MQCLSLANADKCMYIEEGKKDMQCLSLANAEIL